MSSMRPLPSPMRPLPSPPTSSSQSSDSESDSSEYSTPLTAQSFVVRLPIGVEFPKASIGAPRLLKARRREGRIFAHSPSSSISSLDSITGCSIISAQFWIPPTIPAMQTAHLTAIPSEDDTKITPAMTPTTPKMKPKSKPANIVIPRNTPSATVVSPTSPTKSPLPTPTPVLFPTSSPGAVSRTPLCPFSPLSPLSPLSPNRRIPSPNTRIRKLAKLTRTLGENIPIELVFPSETASSSPSTGAPIPAPKPAKKTKKRFVTPVAHRPSPLGPRATIRRAASHYPLTPTPDCTFNIETHAKTAVGLHYALVMESFPNNAVATVRAPPVIPTSPPPFSNTFTVDDVSWECARQAALGATKKPKRVRALALGGVRKAVDNGKGTWRKKESTWSGEWNVEDMEELQVQLRRLRR
ncbi:hypothetical protein DFH06DRAFT_1141002 [Mycena polygramma]|nr:hypothetical protein DFH06DRAFT_1141002 [Mycena polygramma]